ncbi:hypothetical protein SO802_000923 [Lithocarpus litseifolius]|uniref:Expansin-like EG45 domain-containing protein n=1 Tax=Lithocarpus litseifolius TaxID=425828 RepID=A0AAW2DWN3_9ROSI
MDLVSSVSPTIVLPPPSDPLRPRRLVVSSLTTASTHKHHCNPRLFLSSSRRRRVLEVSCNWRSSGRFSQQEENSDGDDVDDHGGASLIVEKREKERKVIQRKKKDRERGDREHRSQADQLLNLFFFFMALSNDIHVPCTGKMHRWLSLLQRLSLFSMVVLFFLHTCCYGDVGTAARNLFAAAGDGIWDNGAACGRQYLVRCISASVRHSCSQYGTIPIKIVDYIHGIPSPPSASNTTMILSSTAFGAIANLTTNSPAINIEFQQ